MTDFLVRHIGFPYVNSLREAVTRLTRAGVLSDGLGLPMPMGADLLPQAIALYNELQVVPVAISDVPALPSVSYNDKNEYESFQ